jgi:hypothetical protein
MYQKRGYKVERKLHLEVREPMLNTTALEHRFRGKSQAFLQWREGLSAAAYARNVPAFMS